jgi:UDP-N-acetyl-D-glucosamine/UDP-N-acetyl-D-galactosamine dehydrogenase
MEEMKIKEKLLNNQGKVAIIGLGYVGLPLAIEFASQISVVGFDIDKYKIEKLNAGIDPNGEINLSERKNLSIHFSSDENSMADVCLFIVAVPTPVDEHNNPDLTILKNAVNTVARNLKKGDYVVFESTVYPGVTEDVCIPILEKNSGLKFREDFKVGYSPERINPGDKVHTLKNTIKVVSGCDKESLTEIATIYNLVADQIYLAPSIKVAEAAKIIENIQRDVNIALMNELSILFGKMRINTYEVLDAAGTKWNFLKFSPGLVGGHCIGVDPYYLAHKARELKYHPQIINAGRFVNDSMGRYTGKQVIKQMLKNGVQLPGANVLILGVTFKEDVSDIRNSKVFDIARELAEFGVQTVLTDAFANPDEVEKEYGFRLEKNPFSGKTNKKFDAIILAVSHQNYCNYSETEIHELLTPNGVFADIKGIYRNKIKSINYWSL